MIFLELGQTKPLSELVKTLETVSRGIGMDSVGILQQNGKLEIFQTDRKENARDPEAFVSPEKVLIFGSLRQCRGQTFVAYLRKCFSEIWTPKLVIEIEQATHSSWLKITKN